MSGFAGVSSIILQLLQSAICNNNKLQTPDANKTGSSTNATASAPTVAPAVSTQSTPAPAARSTTKGEIKFFYFFLLID